MRICMIVAIVSCVGCADNGSGGDTSGDMSSNSGGTGGTGGAGGAGGTGGTGGVGGAGGAGGGGGWWKPTVNATLYWQLTNYPAAHDKNVGVYDIDGFDNDAAEVDALHQAGYKVICYVDTGTYEPGRPDAKDFPAGLKGKELPDWPGEQWLDVRPSGANYATLQSIMTKRFQMCHDKGFDAVEPDNIDSYDNDPGFTTKAADQVTYNSWIADTVHGLGMAVLQKNDLGQVDDLIGKFDALLNEQCIENKECPSLQPYIDAGKPAWDAEYSATGFCDTLVKAGIVGARYALDLDGSLFTPCSNDVGKTW
jgi:hypothetical protein